MPEDKKNQQKGKSDAKDQRKPRQGRQKPGPTKATGQPPVEKKAEEPKVPQKPVYEDPGPEFYKNLKRETEEILKITEEANSKYKKKEIQSNWSKYEMPVESYEDIEEHENLGADYEQLIQMPLSVGGHFQFKHEKSWDISTGPSPYDKYFEIDMNNLATALCTIPFYERNNIDTGIFSECDILTMNNRAVKYKQKYYNDKSYRTPELEAKDKILNSFKELCKNEQENIRNEDSKNEKDILQETSAAVSVKDNNDIDLQLHKNVENIDSNKEIRTIKPQISETQTITDVIEDIDDLILEDSSPPAQTELEKTAPCNKYKNNEVLSNISVKEPARKGATTKTLKPEETKNPVIESPEDLEKWLDDFLDG